MNELFLRLLSTSLVVGIPIVALALSAPLWNKVYAAAWKRRLWCLLALVLVLGAFFRLPEGAPRAVEVSVPERRIVVTAQPDGPQLQLVDTETPFPLLAPEEVPVSPAEGATVGNPAVSGVSLLVVLEGLWLVGTVSFLLWQIVGGWLVSRRVQRWSHAPEGAALPAAYARVCGEKGCGQRAPRLLVCPGIGSPQLRGLLRPQLLVPEEDQSDAEVEWIFRHELTHWDSRDLWWKALFLLANALHWFNPAVWLLRRQAGRDMERACDERVCAGADSAQRRLYGQVLLSSLHKGRQAGLSTYFYGGKVAMKDRLTNILSTQKRRQGAALAMTCALLTVLAVSLVACTQRASEQTAVPQEYRQVLTLSLNGEPYTPRVSWETDTVSADSMGEQLVSYRLPDGGEVVCYWGAGGDYKYWALRRGDVLTRFAQEDSAYEDGYGVTAYTGVFGHDGFRIEGPRGAAYTAYDYYYLDEGGVPRLLADCANYVVERDLNGDGEKELLWFYHGMESYYYFQKNGTLYLEDINALLKETHPDWSVLSVLPDEMAGNLLLIRYQAGADAPPRGGAIGFEADTLTFYEKTGENPADDAVTVIAKAHLQAQVAEMEQRYEVSDDLSEEHFFSDTHIQVLDSRVTELERVALLPAEDGSGQVELWTLGYQLKLQNPDKIPLAGAMTLLGDWLTVGPDGDGYNQPVLALWRNADGSCTQLEQSIMGTIGESYHGSYDFYAAELLHRQTGKRPDTLIFSVYTDPEFTDSGYRLQQAAGQWSLYIPEHWAAESKTERLPDAATSTRRCEGFWHDPADNRVAVLVYRVDGRADDLKLGLNLLHGAAADAGMGEINFVSEGYGNLETSSGMVQAYTAVTDQNVVLQAFAVDDGAGGAWAVVTRCPKEERTAWGDWGWISAITFLAERPEREALLRAYNTRFDPAFDAAFFADLTGDGREELVVQAVQDADRKPLRVADVTPETDWTGAVSVLSAADMGEVSVLYTTSCGTPHAGWGEIYLYRYLGQDCLLEYRPYSSTGSSWFTYTLFTLTDGGYTEILDRDTLEFHSLPEERRAAGVSDAQVQAFLAGVDVYLADARPIMVYDRVLDPLTGEEGDLRFALLEGPVAGLPQNVLRPGEA